MCNKSNMTGATSGAELICSGFLVSQSSFLCSVLQIVVVFFLLAIALSVLLYATACYPFRIFKLVLNERYDSQTMISTD